MTSIPLDMPSTLSEADFVVLNESPKNDFGGVDVLNAFSVRSIPIKHDIEEILKENESLTEALDKSNSSIQKMHTVIANWKQTKEAETTKLVSELKDTKAQLKFSKEQIDTLQSCLMVAQEKLESKISENHELRREQQQNLSRITEQNTKLAEAELKFTKFEEKAKEDAFICVSENDSGQKEKLVEFQSLVDNLKASNKATEELAAKYLSTQLELEEKHQKELNTLQEQLDKLKEELEKTRGTILQKDATINDLESQMAQHEQTNRDFERAALLSNKQCEELRSECEALKMSLAHENEQSETLRKQYDDILKLWQEHEMASPVIIGGPSESELQEAVRQAENAEKLRLENENLVECLAKINEENRKLFDETQRILTAKTEDEARASRSVSRLQCPLCRRVFTDTTELIQHAAICELESGSF